MSKSLTTHLLLAGETGQYTLDLANVVKGEKGVPGTDGSNGQKGAMGQKGQAGANGIVTSVRFAFINASPQTLPMSGTIPVDWDGPNQPVSTIDIPVGECAVDLRDNALYMYLPGTNSANWVKFNIPTTGPQGLTGGVGASGDKGTKGEPGVAGTNGSNGSKGAKGEQGTGGFRGAKGNRGTNGINGEKGLTGEQGQKGTSGTKGEAGAKGHRGNPGQKGSVGAKGNIGATGTGGSKGEKGANADNIGGVARTAVAFNGSGTITMISSYGISEVFRLSHGKYRVRFAKKLPSINYAVIAQANGVNFTTVTSMSQWACEVHVTNAEGQFLDSNYVSVAVFHP